MQQIMEAEHTDASVHKSVHYLTHHLPEGYLFSREQLKTMKVSEDDLQDAREILRVTLANPELRHGAASGGRAALQISGRVFVFAFVPATHPRPISRSGRGVESECDLAQQLLAHRQLHQQQGQNRVLDGRRGRHARRLGGR